MSIDNDFLLTVVYSTSRLRGRTNFILCIKFRNTKYNGFVPEYLSLIEWLYRFPRLYCVITSPIDITPFLFCVIICQLCTGHLHWQCGVWGLWFIFLLIIICFQIAVQVMRSISRILFCSDIPRTRGTILYCPVTFSLDGVHHCVNADSTDKSYLAFLINLLPNIVFFAWFLPSLLVCKAGLFLWNWLKVSLSKRASTELHAEIFMPSP